VTLPGSHGTGTAGRDGNTFRAAAARRPRPRPGRPGAGPQPGLRLRLPPPRCRGHSDSRSAPATQRLSLRPGGSVRVTVTVGDGDNSDGVWQPLATNGRHWSPVQDHASVSQAQPGSHGRRRRLCQRCVRGGPGLPGPVMVTVTVTGTQG
jgi:hypothetical protein